MKIVFILPRPYPHVVGGYKVVYDYANYLARNHDVTIYHVVNMPFSRSKRPSLLKYIYFKLSGSIHFDWYKFSNPVQMKLCHDLRQIEPCECLIATAWGTAYIAHRLRARKKFYLIQGYEIWGGEDCENVFNSYRLEGMTNIVISTFLKEKVETVGGNPCVVVHNGLDLKKFFIRHLNHERMPNSILMMYNRQFEKGAQDGIEALVLVREQIPDIKVTFFGVESFPQNLPSWIRYVCNPKREVLVELYNQNSIFVNASHTEGFGLSIAEAMACGCAVVATDSGGCRDFAIHNETALLSPPQDPKQLACHIIMFLRDSAYKEKIASNGYEKIQEFEIEKACSAFEKCILG